MNLLRADEVVQGRHVSVRTLHTHDIPELHSAELTEPTWQRGRLRATTPAPDAYARGLSGAGGEDQLVVRTHDGALAGLCTFYNTRLSAGTSFVALVAASNRTARLRAIEGALIGVNLTFERWPLRKMYLEVAGYNMDLFRSGVGSLFRQEARLKDHVFLDGRYWDLHYLSSSADSWRERFMAYEPFLLGG